MDSQDHNNAQHSPGGGKSHICSKCGWNYPNPHPSAKNRRAHKKICGTIKGFEILGSDQNLDLQKEDCLEQKTPSPRVVDERIGDVSEEDVFADAVCEFSSSLVSDSVKEKEETAANGMAKSATDLGETQQCNKSPEVVQESLDVVLPVQVLDNFPSPVEAAATCGESSSESLIEQSREAQVIHDGRSSTISNVGLETECKGNAADESESVLASGIGKRVDTSSWNDEVIYSDLEGPHGFAFAVEEMNTNPPGETDYTAVSNKTPPVETTADQVINTGLSALDAIPFAEDNHVSVHGTKGLEEDKLPLEDKTEPHGQTSLVAVKESPSVENIVMPKIDSAEDIKMKPEEGETVRTSLPADVYPFVAVSNADVSHSDLIAPESELIQANVVAEENSRISEHSSESSCAVEHYVSPVSAVSDGDEPSVQNNNLPETSKDSILQTGAEACESTEVDPTVAVSSADVSHSDLIAPENELVQANVVPVENSEHSSQSSCALEHYVTPVSIVLEGDEPSVQNNSSTETSKDSILQTGAEACESTEADPIMAVTSADVSHSDLIAPESELSQANVVAEENSEHSSQSSCAVEHYVTPVSVALEGDEPSVQNNNSSTETSKDSILQIGAEACESSDKEDCTTPNNQKLLESGRRECNRVVGGLGVIQANEIDVNVIKAHSTYAEVPVTIESNDHRDFGRLQNLSEEQIRSLVLSPLVTRDNTSNAITGHSEAENESQSSSVYVGVSKNQEITTSWSTGKEQHVPLKNLLNEARSPRGVAEEGINNIPRVSSILEQGTSPEDEGGWPERREVSEEWNSPAKYPVERKVKGRPFWVPFVCCSSK